MRELLKQSQPSEATDESDVMDGFIEKSKHYAITAASTGSVSFISSMVIVCILLRSHAGLSRIYHRLLFGMCIGDMLSSSIYLMAPAVVPKDMNYHVWNARGNQASCDFQGFVAIFGIFVTSGYNCSLCLYSLARVKYKKTERYIKAKLELWLHCLPIVIALAVSIAGLASQVYNPGLTNCFVSPYNPPHCEGIEKGMIPNGYEIPCGRGTENYDVFYYILLVKNLGILPGIIFGTMAMMYREVLKSEKNMEKYGIGALRLKKLSPGVNGNDNQQDGQDGGKVQKTSIPRRIISIPSRLSRGSTHSNRSMKNTRKVMYRALAYAMAYFATYIFPTIIEIETLASKGKPLNINVQLYLAVIFHPLQGLFNLMVFMYPRVLSAKRSKKHPRSWAGAFVHALVSRGEKVTMRMRSTLSSRSTITSIISQWSVFVFFKSYTCPCQRPSRRMKSALVEGEQETEKKLIGSKPKPEILLLSPKPSFQIVVNKEDEKQPESDTGKKISFLSKASNSQEKQLSFVMGRNTNKRGEEEEEKCEIEPAHVYSLRPPKRQQPVNIYSETQPTKKEDESLQSGPFSSIQSHDIEECERMQVQSEASRDVDCVNLGNHESFQFPIKPEAREVFSTENAEVSLEQC